MGWSVRPKPCNSNLCAKECVGRNRDPQPGGKTADGSVETSSLIRSFNVSKADLNLASAVMCLPCWSRPTLLPPAFFCCGAMNVPHQHHVDCRFEQRLFVGIRCPTKGVCFRDLQVRICLRPLQGCRSQHWNSLAHVLWCMSILPTACSTQIQKLKASHDKCEVKMSGCLVGAGEGAPSQVRKFDIWTSEHASAEEISHQLLT